MSTNLDTMQADVAGGMGLDDGRVIPWQHIGGIAEVAEQLSAKFGRVVQRQEVSGWANRWRTNGFPEHLPTKLGRGLLFDMRETALWDGPGTRWEPGAQRSRAEG